MGKISRFIDKEEGIFPNNIIICFEKQPQFERNFQIEKNWNDWPKWLEFGFLKFPKSYRSTWIIDGQHRLYSFARSKNNSRLAVTAFHELKLERQAGFFIEINKEQKPVERNLLWDLEGEMRPKTTEGKISNVIKKLNGIDPLKNSIYIPLEGPSKRGKLKLASLCTAIKKRRLVEKTTESKIENPYYASSYKKTVDQVSKNLGRYLSIIQKIADEKVNNGFICTNGGLSIIITIFERIIARKKVNPSDKDFEFYLSPVIEYLKDKSDDEIKRLRQRCSSEAGKKDVYKELALEIKKRDKNFDENVEVPYQSEIREFERKLREFVIKKLKEKKF